MVRIASTVYRVGLGPPGIDGYYVARQIRAAPGGKSIRLIALTGWGRDEDRVRSAAAGFDAHLVKPVDYDALTDLIRTSAFHTFD